MQAGLGHVAGVRTFTPGLGEAAEDGLLFAMRSLCGRCRGCAGGAAAKGLFVVLFLSCVGHTNGDASGACAFLKAGSRHFPSRIACMLEALQGQVAVESISPCQAVIA